MRILLFTGKGGVGKTTISAATALRIAGLGYRTLVVSTDPAHSLGDAFCRKLGNTATQLSDNLWAQEINVLQELSQNWDTIRTYLASVIKSMSGLDDVISEEMAVPPGMDEVFGLLEIYSAEKSGKYDCLIIDCAPTAQTLRLLSLPDVATWWIDKILPLERKIAKTIRPIRKSLLGIPIPTEDFYDSMEELFFQIKELKELLMDPDTTSVRLVLNPERMVIEETQRAYTYLNLYGYPVDSVIVNRILPARVRAAYFKDYKRVQQEYLKTIQMNFSPLPVFKASQNRTEVAGHELLLDLAQDIYGEHDPRNTFYKGQPQKFLKENGNHLFVLSLPFLDKADLEVFKDEDQLIIRAGSYKREIFLPNPLAVLKITNASFKENELRITFSKGA